jgi:hypothetical protein
LSGIKSFNLNNGNISELLDILTQQTGDISGCLLQCSSQGKCQLNQITQMYECVCDTYFSGSACQYDSRPCSSGPCLNNGTCTNVQGLNSTLSFECECQNTYYGTYCEKQIDVCQNKTCNGKGYCFNSQNEPKCKCFSGYSGDECDLISTFVKIVRPTFQLTTTLICSLVIGATILTVVSSDLWNIIITKSLKRKIIEEKRNEKKAKESIQLSSSNRIEPKTVKNNKSHSNEPINRTRSTGKVLCG